MSTNTLPRSRSSSRSSSSDVVDFDEEDEAVANSDRPRPRHSSFAHSNSIGNHDMIAPYIDVQSIGALPDDEEDDVFDDDSVLRNSGRDHRRRLGTNSSAKMVGFVKNVDDHGKNARGTSVTTTGNFTERLRQLRASLMSKLTSDDYSHKYSLYGGPVDRWNRCYLSFCFLGICTLLPWNFFMSADSYWKYKLRNVTDVDVETDMQEKFQAYLAIAAFIPNILILFLASLLTRFLSAKTRLLSSTLLVAVFFAATSAMVLVDTDDIQRSFFLGTLISVVFINGGSAVMQSGVFGLAGLLPQRFMQGVMHGQAMGGTIAALASIITLAIGSDDETTTIEYATFGYFLLATVFMVLAAIVSVAVLKSNYLSFTVERSHSPILTSFSPRRKYGINEDAEGSEESLLAGQKGGGGGGGSGREGARKEGSSDEDPSSGYGESLVAVKQKPRTLGLFKKIAPEAFSAFITFAVTISVFPGIISLIAPVTAKKDTTYAKFFSPVFCFFLFNFGDLIGRTLAGRIQFPRPRSPRWILPLICVIRLAFIPAFMLCNIEVAHPRNLSTIFNHDAYFISFMTLFSISNGYFASLAMMFGPKRVDDSQAEKAGSLMAAFLALGLGTGAGLTYLIVTVV